MEGKKIGPKQDRKLKVCGNDVEVVLQFGFSHSKLNFCPVDLQYYFFKLIEFSIQNQTRFSIRQNFYQFLQPHKTIAPSQQQHVLFHDAYMRAALFPELYPIPYPSLIPSSGVSQLVWDIVVVWPGCISTHNGVAPEDGINSTGRLTSRRHVGQVWPGGSVCFRKNRTQIYTSVAKMCCCAS